MDEITAHFEEQFRKLKRDNQYAVLFIRLGDFCELFYEDARLIVTHFAATTARKRDNKYYCSIPYSFTKFYVEALKEMGHKAVVLEEDLQGDKECQKQ